MDAVFARLRLRARVALCGLVSAYNDPEPPPGPRSFGSLLVQRLRLQGVHRARSVRPPRAAVSEPSAWMREGRLKALETVVERFEQLPTAINMLFDGANVGKLVLRVAD